MILPDGVPHPRPPRPDPGRRPPLAVRHPAEKGSSQAEQDCAEVAALLARERQPTGTG
ncbi:hypothetical protein SBD_2513 [Streptomyces bottropensis ATCC 25435]|uniref:Uncharacterized protein n=1 Tax=Streptomyces bottropensis ATCC 25435 TaxID=1054862 RepID=M3FQH2_9ACTN|nr:hypothetical protein SBD_2513 [Streptomyces bottropensis ATCC 25435]